MSDQATLDRYREELLSGKTLRNHAASHRSRYSYMPPATRQQYGHAVETLGKMAQSTDQMAQIAAGIVRKLSPYGTRADLCAKMYEAAAEVMIGLYDDVIGRSGPEAGRYSDHLHGWTLYDRVAVHYWLELASRGATDSAAGVGWCLETIAGEVEFYPTQEMRR